MVEEAEMVQVEWQADFRFGRAVVVEVARARGMIGRAVRIVVVWIVADRVARKIRADSRVVGVAGPSKSAPMNYRARW
jgi:hypothetical protein